MIWSCLTTPIRTSTQRWMVFKFLKPSTNFYISTCKILCWLRATGVKPSLGWLTGSVLPSLYHSWGHHLVWDPSCSLFSLPMPCFKSCPFMPPHPCLSPLSMILTFFTVFANHCYSFCGTHLSSIMDVRKAIEDTKPVWESEWRSWQPNFISGQ